MFCMIIGKVFLTLFLLIHKLVLCLAAFKPIKCISIDFVALGNMVLVMRPYADGLLVVMTVLGWVCPISTSVTHRDTVCLQL